MTSTLFKDVHLPMFKDITITSSYHYIFYLRRANPVTAYIDDIIKTTSDLIIPFLRAMGAISSEEVTYEHRDGGI